MPSDIHDPFNAEGQLSMERMRLLAEQAAAANAQMVNGSLHGVYGPAGSVIVNTGQSVGVRGIDTHAYFLPGGGGRLSEAEATARRQAREYVWYIHHPHTPILFLYDGPLAEDIVGIYYGVSIAFDGTVSVPLAEGFYPYLVPAGTPPSAPPAELPAELFDSIGPTDQFVRDDVRYIQIGQAYTGLAWVDRSGGVYELVIEPATEYTPGALTDRTQFIGGSKTFRAEMTAEDSILLYARAEVISFPGSPPARLVYTRGLRLMTYGRAEANGTDPETYTHLDTIDSNGSALNNNAFGPPADDALIICDPDVGVFARDPDLIGEGDLFGFQSGHKHYEIDWRGGRIRWYDPLYGYDPVPPQPNWPGSKGRMTTDGTYLYVCVGPSAWRRVLIDVW